MARKMVINAVHREESRVAIIENNRLVELEVERADQVQLKGNIYKAAISRVEPSLQAAFLDIGSSRNGFLQINDIHSAYFQDWPPEGGASRPGRPSIQQVLRQGQELVVQVVKDERDAKGATLTTNLSIPGRYLVLMVGNQRGGVSRKINDDNQRRKLKQSIQQLRVPPGMGVIVRTAGINRSYQELQSDLDGLMTFWRQLVSETIKPGAPRLLYQESDLIIRSIRDYLRSDFDEVVVDDPQLFARTESLLEKTAPSMKSKLKLYDRQEPIFSHYGLDVQIDAIHHADVTLPSGGSIVISPTEAVVSIDVNSGRSTSQSDVEETAFNTNKEAAIAVAEQLRLRDLGGLVVIDFIDMMDRRHKQVVERTLREAVRNDRAKVEVGRISKFGLLEMSRQRLKWSLTAQSHIKCPHCKGRGLVKLPDAAALEALRKVESAVFVGKVKSVKVHMAPSAALFLLNEKRQNLTRLETEGGATVRVYADSRLIAEDYKLVLDHPGDEPASAPPPPSRALQENKNSGAGRDRRGPPQRSGTGRGNDSRRRPQRRSDRSPQGPQSERGGRPANEAPSQENRQDRGNPTSGSESGKAVPNFKSDVPPVTEAV